MRRRRERERGQERERDQVINKLPIPVYKNTTAHDKRAMRRTVRFGKTKTKTRVFTGLKHQCVELARRWCVRSRGATFREVDTASDMVSLRRGTCLACGRPVRISVSNAVAPSSTLAGDLLVWKRGLPGPYRKTGHVAVVVKVESNKKNNGAALITVAEQNGSTKNGHRKIRLNQNSKTRRALAGRLRVFPCTSCKV
jgi:hypothetical protein